jgi:5-formyltetrahydrofolate cyclo-ligase
MRRDLRRVAAGLSERAGVAVGQYLRSSDAWKAASEIVVFVSMPGEIDTHVVIDSAVQDSKLVLLPRVVGEGELEFAVLRDRDGLVSGPFGVLEPGAECPARAIREDSLVLVPGLAFDQRGGRLGRGAGYYDRALAKVRVLEPRPRCLGLGFALQIVEDVPMTSLDVRLDGVVTEEGLFFSNRADEERRPRLGNECE